MRGQVLDWIVGSILVTIIKDEKSYDTLGERERVKYKTWPAVPQKFNVSQLIQLKDLSYLNLERKV